MNQAKIQLSPTEMELVTNAEWILTKNAILGKVKSMLELVHETQITSIKDTKRGIQSLLARVPAKISRGENYKGLPYLVLDYPRVFEKENILAIRTLFWWSHFFSITLHISGSYKSEFQEKIISSFEKLKDDGFSVSQGVNEWEHHFDPDNYIPLVDLTKETFAQVVAQNDFVKIAYRIPLQQWEHVQEKLNLQFNRFITYLCS